MALESGGDYPARIVTTAVAAAEADITEAMRVGNIHGIRAGHVALRHLATSYPEGYRVAYRQPELSITTIVGEQ